MAHRENITYPNTKGRTTWTHYHSAGSFVRDTTVSPTATAAVFSWDGGWCVADRTGLEDGTPPVRSIVYPVATPHAAWELYRHDHLAAR